MSNSPTIRQPVSADAAAVAGLIGQLGYPASAAEAAERLLKLAAHAHAATYVAELDGRVVGVITAHTFPTVHATAPAAWITTLVVDESCRGRGAGRALVAATELWAIAGGSQKISVTSALRRLDAHAFYEALGYAHSGLRLAKQFHVANEHTT